jgi:hypothetical protein
MLFRITSMPDAIQLLRIERRAAGTRNGALARFSYPSNVVTMQVTACRPPKPRGQGLSVNRR